MCYQVPNCNKVLIKTDNCCNMYVIVSLTGLIRGIDAEKGCIYVTTAEAPGAADTLVYADWAPEPPGATRLPAGTTVPYRAPHEAQLRQLMTAPRRRYNPIQLLKTSRIPKVKASS